MSRLNQKGIISEPFKIWMGISILSDTQMVGLKILVQKHPMKKVKSDLLKNPKIQINIDDL